MDLFIAGLGVLDEHLEAGECRALFGRPLAVAGLRVLDEDFEGREAGALVVIEVLNGFQVPVGIEEGADVGEGEAAILLENSVSGPIRAADFKLMS